VNQKTTARCEQLVASLLAPGETVELAEAAQIGKISAKRQLATQLAVAAATAGTVAVHVKPAAFYLVVTNQRLFLIENRRGLVGKVVTALPRTQINAGPLRSGPLNLSAEVTIDGTTHRFSWGRFQGRMARSVTAALAAAPAVS
jgi:hypothetical protein